MIFLGKKTNHILLKFFFTINISLKNTSFTIKTHSLYTLIFESNKRKQEFIVNASLDLYIYCYFNLLIKND